MGGNKERPSDSPGNGLSLLFNTHYHHHSPLFLLPLPACISCSSIVEETSKNGEREESPERRGEGKDLTKTIKTDFFQADESSNPLLTVAPFRVPPRLSNLSFSSSPPDSLFRLPSDLVNSWWKISKNRRNLFLAKCHCCESCASYDSSIINDEGIYYIIGCIFRVEQWQQSSFWGERGVNNRCFRFIC